MFRASRTSLENLSMVTKARSITDKNKQSADSSDCYFRLSNLFAERIEEVAKLEAVQDETPSSDDHLSLNVAALTNCQMAFCCPDDILSTLTPGSLLDPKVQQAWRDYPRLSDEMRDLICRRILQSIARSEVKDFHVKMADKILRGIDKNGKILDFTQLFDRDRFETFSLKIQGCKEVEYLWRIKQLQHTLSVPGLYLTSEESTPSDFEYPPYIIKAIKQGSLFLVRKVDNGGPNIYQYASVFVYENTREDIIWSNLISQNHSMDHLFEDAFRVLIPLACNKEFPTESDFASLPRLNDLIIRHINNLKELSENKLKDNPEKDQDDKQNNPLTCFRTTPNNNQGIMTISERCSRAYRNLSLYLEEIAKDEKFPISPQFSQYVYSASIDIFNFSLNGLDNLPLPDEKERYKTQLNSCLKNFLQHLGELKEITKSPDIDRASIYLPALLDKIKESITNNPGVLDKDNLENIHCILLRAPEAIDRNNEAVKCFYREYHYYQASYSLMAKAIDGTKDDVPHQDYSRVFLIENGIKKLYNVDKEFVAAVQHLDIGVLKDFSGTKYLKHLNKQRLEVLKEIFSPEGVIEQIKGKNSSSKLKEIVANFSDDAKFYAYKLVLDHYHHKSEKTEQDIVEIDHLIIETSKIYDRLESASLAKCSPFDAQSYRQSAVKRYVELYKKENYQLHDQPVFTRMANKMSQPDLFAEYLVNTYKLARYESVFFDISLPLPELSAIYYHLSGNPNLQEIVKFNMARKMITHGESIESLKLSQGEINQVKARCFFSQWGNTLNTIEEHQLIDVWKQIKDVKELDPMVASHKEQGAYQQFHKQLTNNIKEKESYFRNTLFRGVFDKIIKSLPRPQSQDELTELVGKVLNQYLQKIPNLVELMGYNEAEKIGKQHLATYLDASEFRENNKSEIGRLLLKCILENHEDCLEISRKDLSDTLSNIDKMIGYCCQAAKEGSTDQLQQQKVEKLKALIVQGLNVLEAAVAAYIPLPKRKDSDSQSDLFKMTRSRRDSKDSVSTADTVDQDDSRNPSIKISGDNEAKTDLEDSGDNLDNLKSRYHSLALFSKKQGETTLYASQTVVKASYKEANSEFKEQSSVLTKHRGWLSYLFSWLPFVKKPNSYEIADACHKTLVSLADDKPKPENIGRPDVAPGDEGSLSLYIGPAPL